MSQFQALSPRTMEAETLSLVGVHTYILYLYIYRTNMSVQRQPRKLSQGTQVNTNSTSSLAVQDGLLVGMCIYTIFIHTESAQCLMHGSQSPLLMAPGHMSP